MAISAGTVLLSVMLVRHLVTGLTCKDGYFVNENNDCIACPEHCLFCDSDEYCLHCKKGFWGRLCELPCINCKAGTSCEKTNGFCKYGCTYGYSGILCDITCDKKCLSCTRGHSQNCLKCASGRYPSISCNKVCSGCHEQNCDETGVCLLKCVNGSWGQRCEQKCPQHCKYESCDRDNGTCIFGCTDDSLGLQCHGTNSNIDDKNSTPIVVVVVPTCIVVIVLVGISIGIYRKWRKSHQDSRSAAEEEGLVSGQSSHVNDGKSRGKDKRKHIKRWLQKDGNRVLQETGLNLYDCLYKCIDSLIPLLDPGESTTEMKMFVSAEVLQEKVVTLLKSHASSWKTMLPLLVDDLPLPSRETVENEEKEYLEKVKDVYTEFLSECSKGVYKKTYTKLYLYASATCINTKIYVISDDQQWYYFEPLFTFNKQPKKSLRFITMYVSSESLFYKVESKDPNAPLPKARGIVGMYKKFLEDKHTSFSSVLKDLRKIRRPSKINLCKSFGQEIIMDCW